MVETGALIRAIFLATLAAASAIPAVRSEAGVGGDPAATPIEDSTAMPAGQRLGADQVSAARLLGATLTGKNGRALGTVSDLLVDGGERRVAFIGLRPAASGESLVAMPWASLSPGAAGTARYVAAAAAASAAEDLPFAQQAAADPAFLDVRRDLLGRPVLAAAGETVGRLVDFDVDLRSGTIGYLFITTTEMAESGDQLRAIPWSAVADLADERPIVLTPERPRGAERTALFARRAALARDVHGRRRARLTAGHFSRTSTSTAACSRWRWPWSPAPPAAALRSAPSPRRAGRRRRAAGCCRGG